MYELRRYENWIDICNAPYLQDVDESALCPLIGPNLEFSGQEPECLVFLLFLFLPKLVFHEASYATDSNRCTIIQLHPSWPVVAPAIFPPVATAHSPWITTALGPPTTPAPAGPGCRTCPGAAHHPPVVCGRMLDVGGDWWGAPPRDSWTQLPACPALPSPSLALSRQTEG